MLRSLTAILFFVSALLVCSNDVSAKSKRLEIGATAPAWSNLVGVDGKHHSLAELDEATVVVVIFTSNTCPVAGAYEERLNKLAEGYQEKGVVVVAINANHSETIEAMIKRAEEKKFRYCYVLDGSQEVAKAYGASRTPEVFVINKERKIVYTGAIDDDGTLSGKADTHYMRDAIDATLAGKVPERPTTEAFGCAIKWKR